MFMLFLSGCSLFNPYVDRRRNPGVSDVALLYTGPSRPNQPVICYNPLLTDDEELQKMADDECVKNQTGTRAVFVKKTYFDGKLLLPNHARYVCTDDNSENADEAIINQYTEPAEENINQQEKDEDYNEFAFGE